MEYKIQSLVLPTEEKHQDCRKLFYRGDHGILDRTEKTLTLGFGQRSDFVTYLNAVSYRKWKKYTHAGELTLHLDIEGDFRALFLGYHKDVLTVSRVEFAEEDFIVDRKGKKRREVIYTFPDNEEQMVGFELSALSENAKIYGGYYTVKVKKKDLNDIKLSLATTTFAKEEFITKNIALLKSEILSSQDDIAKNLYIHVVDNGRTLKPEDVFCESDRETLKVGDTAKSSDGRIFLHPNKNVGGSGGFARGMIESLKQDDVTHVLLMDDDVLVLPESICRTYNLLRLQRDEYKGNFISGAMLYYENPRLQHEDIGTIQADSDNCIFKPLKPELDLESLTNVLEMERDFTMHKNSYAAWWYCCIPRIQIEKNGLPLPIFIRGDDSEYSLRARPGFISMCGICVWHLGFITKYNTTFDKYQTHRNLFIAQSASHVLSEANLAKVIYTSMRIELMQFNYDAAELVIKSFEDYLKGPNYLMKLNGEDNNKENFKLNDQLIPLSEIEGGNSFNPTDCFYDPPRRFFDRILTRLTWNGQRWTPQFLERHDIVPISFDWSIQAQKISMQTSLIAVNPFSQTGIIRRKDKARFRELMNRYKAAQKKYQLSGAKIADAWHAKKSELTSEEFWKDYLEI